MLRLTADDLPNGFLEIFGLEVAKGLQLPHKHRRRRSRSCGIQAQRTPDMSGRKDIEVLSHDNLRYVLGHAFRAREIVKGPFSGSRYDESLTVPTVVPPRQFEVKVVE